MMSEDLKQMIESSVTGATAHVMEPKDDGQHFEAIVISPNFEGLPLVKQHQMVMKPLKEEFKQSVHALGLRTFTPNKWNEVKTQYGF